MPQQIAFSILTLVSRSLDFRTRRRGPTRRARTRRPASPQEGGRGSVGDRWRDAERPARGDAREVCRMSKRGWALLGLVAAISLAGCASDDWQQKYEEQQRLNLDLCSQNDDLKTARAESAAKNEQIAAQMRTLDMEAQKAREAAEAANRQNDELRGKATAGTPAPAGTSGGFDSKAIHDIAEQIKRDLGKGGEVAVTQDGNIEITLESDVTFSSGSAELSDAGKKSLRGLSGLLKGKFAPY